MTRKFLIATHGTFAAGVKSSLDIIIGSNDNVFLIQAYVDENKAIDEEVKSILASISDEDELVIFSDLLGGSVTNQVLQYASRKNIHIVSGFNLPLLIDIMLADMDTPVVDVIEQAINNAKDQMVYVNKLIASTKAENNND